MKRVCAYSCTFMCASVFDYLWLSWIIFLFSVATFSVYMHHNACIFSFLCCLCFGFFLHQVRCMLLVAFLHIIPFPTHYHSVSHTLPLHFPHITLRFPHVTTPFPTHYHSVSHTLPLRFPYITTPFPTHYHSVSLTLPIHFPHITTPFPS